MTRTAKTISLLLCICCTVSVAIGQNNPACLLGDISIIKSQEPLSALPGFLFSTYPADKLLDSPNGPPAGGFPGWEPFLITAKVTSPKGTGIAGCDVTWKTTNGYFYTWPLNAKSDINGIVSGYLRGDVGTIALTASLDKTNMTDTQLFTVLEGNHNNTGAALHGSFLTPESSEFMVDIIPTTTPPFHLLSSYCTRSFLHWTSNP